MNAGHRPLTTKQRQGFDRKNQPQSEWQTRCECGWASPWDPKHWRAHVDLNEHIVGKRAPG